MTAPEKQDEPLDLTGQGFVSGDGSGAGYGMVSTVGTGTAPTWNQGAKNGGVPGGTGTGTKPSAHHTSSVHGVLHARDTSDDGPLEATKGAHWVFGEPFDKR
jgi:hypothetical protein